jgi:hypothetical protein
MQTLHNNHFNHSPAPPSHTPHILAFASSTRPPASSACFNSLTPSSCSLTKLPPTAW